VSHYWFIYRHSISWRPRSSCH